MNLLFLLGIIVLAGFLGGKITNKMKSPAAVGYILTGILLGPSLSGIINDDLLRHAGLISDFALGIIAFIIGSGLRLNMLRKMGKAIFYILFAESIITFILLTLGIYFVSRNIALSIILGSLGVASAPAGTYIVLREYRAKGTLTDTLLSVVGLDDGLGVVIFSFSLGLAKILVNTGEHISFHNTFIEPTIEIIGAIILGIVLGVITAYTIRNNHDRNEVLAVTLSMIFVCAGLAGIFHFSLLLSCLVLGLTIVNRSSFVGKRMADSIQTITYPIFIVFFVLAGAHLEISLLPKIGLLGFMYLIMRSLGKIGGTYIGAYIGKAEKKIKKYLGYGLFTQAGVAVGLAMLVGKELGTSNEITVTVITVITATTVILELLGAYGVKYAITKAEEIGKAK